MQEFKDKRKDTRNHLSIAGGKLCWVKSNPEQKQAGLGMSNNNNVPESVFRVLTEDLTKSCMT